MRFYKIDELIKKLDAANIGSRPDWKPMQFRLFMPIANGRRPDPLQHLPAKFQQPLRS
jgi:hypothetical protein